MIAFWDSSAPATDNERPPIAPVPLHARPWLRLFVPPDRVIVQKPAMPVQFRRTARRLLRGLHR